MNRLDRAISDVAYILDTLMAYRNIVETGCCNDCEKKSECRYAPKPGQLARYNCPFYEKEGMEKFPEKDSFYDFLWNTINPNDMEMYLKMFRSTQEKTDEVDG